MQDRRLLIPLVLALAFGLLAAWQLLAPSRAGAPAGGNLPVNTAAARDASRPLDGVSPDALPEKAPGPITLPEPPAAPEIRNDPAGGSLWLRVIDADTNQPLALADCELWPALQMAGWPSWGYIFNTDDCHMGSPTDPPQQRARLDEHGMLALRCETLATEPDNIRTLRDTTKQVLLAPEGWRMMLPIPPGYEPAALAGTISTQARKLAEVRVATPSPIDWLVRKAPGLRVTVQDGQQRPLAGLAVWLIPEEAPTPVQHWAVVQSGSYGYTHGPTVLGGEAGPLWGPSMAERQANELQYLRELAAQPHCVDDIDLESELEGIDEDDPVAEAGRTQFFSVTGAAGMAEWPTLFTGRWRVLTFGGGQAITEQVVELRQGLHELTLNMPAPTFGTLRVIAVHTGSEEPGGLGLRVESVGPFGRFPDDFGLDVISNGFVRDTGNEFLVGGLTPGFWLVSLGDDYGYHSVVVQLAAGEHKTVEIIVGDDAFGTWAPFLRFGGRPVKGGMVWLRGGQYADAEQISLEWEDDALAPTPIELATGHYVAWVPGLPPVQFEIKPRQTTSTAFDVPTASVSFSIDQTLAAWLSPDGDPIRLDLHGTGVYEDSEFFHAMGMVLFDQDEGYEFLSPGRNSNWWVPPCEYRWELHGGENYLEGTLRIAAGSTTVHFSFNNLPGLACLEITVPDAEDDTELYVDMDQDNNPIDLVAAWRSMSDGVEPWNGHDVGVEQLRLPGTNRWLVLGPAGTQTLRLIHGENQREYVVTLPGSLTARLSELGPDVDTHGRLVLELNEGDMAEYQGTALGPGYWCEVAPDSYNGLPLGPVTVHLTRRLVDENGEYTGVVQSHSFSATLGEEPHVVKVSGLPWVTAATLTLTCQGYGDPGNPVDPWWMPASRLGPRIASISIKDGNRWWPVDLQSPDEICPGGRIEFAYKDRPLPPGTYRVVPWPGAAEKYCREFELKPGQHLQVTIKTGN